MRRSSSYGPREFSFNDGAMGKVELPAELRAWIGRESAPMRAPGAIEWSDVRRYVNATGDSNPLWGAADLDGNPGRVGALAPPAMILDVLRPPKGQDAIGESGGRAFSSVGGLAGGIFIPHEVARFNAETEIEWLRPLRIGDWITVRFKILDISYKDTASGPAVFITEERKCFDQSGQPVAVIRQVSVRTLVASDSSMSG